MPGRSRSLRVPKVTLPKEERDKRKEEKKNLTVADTEIYEMLDKRDEQQIIQTLQGRYLDEFIYSFTDKAGKEVVGLSWLGVQEASREYGGIRVPIDKVQRKETDGEIEFLVEAIDERTGSSRLGLKCQPKKKRLKTGFLLDDPFYKETCLSKAQRNAIRALLPQTLIKEWVERHRTKNKKNNAEKEEKENNTPQSPAIKESSGDSNASKENISP